MRSFFASLWVVVLLALPMAAQAANEPETNPLCWTKEQCQAARQQINPNAKPDDGGWVQDVGDICNGKWGRCLPAGVVKTEIGIGGQTDYRDVGQYLQTIFNFAIGIAGIVSVSVIIIAGFQWTTSGGNSESITSAKKHIGGAIMGVFLAFTSYFILYALNPAFVNLRLPRSWMLRPLHALPTFCSAMPAGTGFEQAIGFTDQISSVTLPANAQYAEQLGTDQQKNETYFRCGNRLFIKDTVGATCFGDVCKSGEKCIPVINVDGADKKRLYDCYQGQLIIHYTVDSMGESFAHALPFGGTLEQPNWLDTVSDFWGICGKGGSSVYVVGASKSWSGNKKQVNHIQHTSSGFDEYVIIYNGFDTETDWGCPNDTQLVGVVLKNELGLNWTITKDANFMVGMDRSNTTTVAGSWKTVGARHYIPYRELLDKGIYLELPATTDVINDAAQSPSIAPEKGAVQ